MSYLARLTVLILWSGLLVAGCGSTENASDDDDSGLDRSSGPAMPFSGMRLAPTDDAVRSVQLYRGREAELPIVRLGGDGERASSNVLTLAFDLVEARGRSLSVYFYHADRTWQRDLSPPEYLEAFSQDALTDYSISGGTEVPYVHYEYTFPNETIRFRISGNYVVRVTEQGDEDAVLLERPFFVTERQSGADLRLSELMAGRGFPATQPTLLFTPPSALGANVFDYSTCFVRNGEWEEARCSQRTPRTAASALEFELQPEHAFEAEPANFFLDISDLEVGGDIVEVNRAARPTRVELDIDYTSFTGQPAGVPLNGQSLIADAPRSDERAGTEADYVDVLFTYVPPEEERLFGPLYLIGSFNDWRRNDDYRMEWNEDENRYEGTFLIKQGLYEYRYTSDDERLHEALRDNLPPRSSLFTALVYYEDVSLRTDRLIGTAVAQPGR